jgi:RNA polymerase subunit RPABC4/transcription elongation factor Spt4/cell division protein FtsL
MAFFDKLSEIAKTATDKAGVAVEVTKLNTKIGSERSKINNLKTQIGEFFIAQYEAGTTFQPEVMDLFAQIDACNGAIVELQAEIARVKEEKTEPATAPSGAAVVCPSCGAQVGPGKKFCPECGGKLDAAPASKACASCGAQIPADVKFCPECGSPV